MYDKSPQKGRGWRTHVTHFCMRNYVQLLVTSCFFSHRGHVGDFAASSLHAMNTRLNSRRDHALLAIFNAQAQRLNLANSVLMAHMHMIDQLVTIQF